MDVVISSGVLHHTRDTRLAFHSIARLVKPGGHIVLGLYNRIGRMRTHGRRLLARMFGNGVLWLDPVLRRELSPEKRRAWTNDQYYHPCERSHSMSEVLTWLVHEGFEFTSSVPPVGNASLTDQPLFAPSHPGTPLDRLLAQFGILFSSLGGEGGLFIMIGRRRGAG
jgi:SAM-dependent methyltransferase